MGVYTEELPSEPVNFNKDVASLPEVWLLKGLSYVSYVLSVLVKSVFSVPVDYRI